MRPPVLLKYSYGKQKLTNLDADMSKKASYDHINQSEKESPEMNPLQSTTFWLVPLTSAAVIKI